MVVGLVFFGFALPFGMLPIRQLEGSFFVPEGWLVFVFTPEKSSAGFPLFVAQQGAF